MGFPVEHQAVLLMSYQKLNLPQHTREDTDKKKNVCGAQKPQLWNLLGIPQGLGYCQIADFQGAIEMDRKEMILDIEFEGVWDWKIMRFKSTLLI